MSKRERIHKKLSEIVSPSYVSEDLELAIYYWDYLTCSIPPGQCDFVVMPETTLEVQEIVRLANQERIPVVPSVANSCGGMATPLRGGIVVDLRRMNQVQEVECDDMYALVQGGITWGDLEGYLQRYHPELRAAIPYTSPAAGVIPCYLEYGLVNLGMLGGSGADFINGLEVVLPNGEVALTGAAAYNQKNWTGRTTGPDITGLFIGNAGRAGIVTKASIKLWPKLPRSDWYISAENYKRGVEIVKGLYKAGGPTLGIVDLGTMNYASMIGSAGVSGLDLEKVPYEADKAGLPDFYGSVSVEAYTEKEMEAKAETITDIVTGMEGELTLTEDAFEATPLEQRGEAPTYVGTLPHQYYMWYFYMGGVGDYLVGYLPINRLSGYYLKSRKVAMKYGKHNLFFHRVMSGGHYHGTGVLLESNKDDPEDMKRTRRCLMKIDKVLRDFDGVVHKPNYWRARRSVSSGNPVSMKLIRDIRKMFDPNGILNPGQGI